MCRTFDVPYILGRRSMPVLLVLLTITVILVGGGTHVVLIVRVRHRPCFSSALQRWSRQQRRILVRRRQALQWQQLRVADEQAACSALQVGFRTAGQQTACTGLHDNYREWVHVRHVL